jgi:hypothetical protein
MVDRRARSLIKRQPGSKRGRAQAPGGRTVKPAVDRAGQLRRDGVDRGREPRQRGGGQALQIRAA